LIPKCVFEPDIGYKSSLHNNLSVDIHYTYTQLGLPVDHCPSNKFESECQTCLQLISTAQL